MNLLTPASSMESVNYQIKSGANEIYIGMNSNIYKNYSFTGRGQVNDIKESIVPSLDDLNEIVKLAHKNNVSVNFAANTPLFSDAKYGVIDIEKSYIKYIYQGIECGVDNIIVGDIGLIYKLGKMNLPVNIHASTFFDTMNIAQLRFLKELGVKRSTLTYQISMNEIKELCKSGIMEIEVIGYMGCSFFNGSCNFIHNLGENSLEQNIEIGIPCKSLYNVNGNGINKESYPYLDAELGCALCSVYELIENGVDAIKIVGRDINHKKISKITTLFRKAIDLANNTNNKEFNNLVKDLRYNWWKRIWCEKNKCKYSKNIITDSYIGIN